MQISKDSYIISQACASALLACLVTVPHLAESQQACQNGRDGDDKSPISLLGGVLTVPHDYNKNVQPPDDPARVQIGFIVSDIMEVNEDKYTISMKVRLKENF